MRPSSALVAALALIGTTTAPRAADTSHWIGVWGASPSTTSKTESYVGQTIRQTVHLDGGGRRLRLRLSNALSNDRLILGAVTLAEPGARPGAIEAKSLTPVTFLGAPIVAVPAHATIVSDPVPMAADGGRDVVVSLLVAASRGPTQHEVASATSFVAPGDQTRATVLRYATPRDTRVVLAGVEAEAEPTAGTVVALGDSITDGFHSTPDLDRRWPDVLARRLQAAPGLPRYGIVNAGISGNRLLRDDAGPNAISRLPRDVLALPGLRIVCLLEGINDIGAGATSTDAATRVTAADLIAGYGQVILQAHEHGAKVFIGTLTPFSGSGIGETVRQQVNAWIRAKDGFDGVLDFDAALRDPGKPSQLLAGYDSGDHIHPSDAGYAAMADAIDLDLFR